ncbi:type VII secretion-associated serine protease mycosin [Serratia quinivorans]|uniref:S8 family peptidase n=1 Tax=Serratia quinivorans TaxID=137545 RepID=UPI00217C6418|nr:S8 family peptidase [Serratia quinivorans]CAI1514083.1 type VII secretion-associated serine protease mycosin [Serratia quinivorans]
MKNNPIQIVLNTSDYIDSPTPDANGSNKEFYPNKDDAFKKHKNEILSSMFELQSSLLKKEHHTLFAHVTLKPAGWAKSHRPNKSIFKSSLVPYVGGGDIGEMIVEVNVENIESIITSIEKAEEFTKEKFNEKTRKIEFKPSRSKSEVGAISSIREHDESDKRNFSIEMAFKWLQNPDCGGVYFVEVFTLGDHQDEKTSRINTLHDDFDSLLEMISIESKKYVRTGKNSGSVYYVIYVPEGKNGDIEFHRSLLTIINNHDAVKKIHLPPVITASQQDILYYNEKGNSFDFNVESDVDYPIVGIVDTGVASIEHLDDWRVGGADFIMSTKQDRSHGTFIAGLLSAGNVVNPNLSALKEVPCKFYDLDLYPTNKNEFSSNYPRGFVDFLRQLDAEVQDAKGHGVRIFNMSLSLMIPVDDDSYSFYASMIDDISDDNDVIFVLPAGNLTEQLLRDDWPESHADILSMLAKYRYQGKDKILQPCESVRSISVGALDPAHHEKNLKPSRYTRRGPGPSLGVKPDLCHIGGALEEDSGLYSLSVSGGVVSSCGTSYAAPLVAKTLAVLDKQITGYVSREVLYGLLIHHAQIPKGLRKKELKEISRDFVGFGLPPVAEDMVLYDDSSITLVFNGNFRHQHDLLSFDLTWPQCLTDEEGKCRGDVTMTLVYSPYCDNRFGNEFIRLNLDACLRQAVLNEDTGEVVFKGAIKDSIKSSHESELIKNGMKWWPSKKFEWKFRGKGSSSSWRVVIESLLRSDVIFPSEGIPFSVLLTISDPKKGGKVFNEVRTSLVSAGVNIADIRTSNVIRTRR